MLIHGYSDQSGALAFVRNSTELCFKINTTTPSSPFIENGEGAITVEESVTPGVYDLFLDYNLRYVLFQNVGISWNGAAPSTAAQRLFARMKFVASLPNNVWHYQVWAQEMAAGTIQVPPDGFFVNFIFSDAGTS